MEKSTGATTASFFLDLLFPRTCLRCDALIPTSIPDTYICENCRASILPLTASRCPFCHRATILWQTCNDCRPTHSLDSLLVASDYGDMIIKRMVKALKYRFVDIVADDIGTFMAGYLTERKDLLGFAKTSPVLCSIPLHPKRLRWRGFNQAELIANKIATICDLPVRHDLLTRTEHKTAQADIKNRDERIQNAKDLFSLAVSPLNIKNIILIDDVATTGATMNSAAKILKSAGAKHVFGFVFARGG